MNPKHISLAFAAAASLLAGCAKSSFEGPIDGQSADLELSYVGATETKAAIDGTTFPTDGEIGLFLFEDEQATTPYGDGYANVKYSYNSTKEKWTASPSIKVGSTPGYLYGYYPYSGTATDIKAIPVSSSLNGDDVMYAAKQSCPITDVTASQTTITMNHALARVSITVKNNGYTGEAKLSQIKLEGAKIASSGTLNALDGKITATKADEVVLSVPTAEQTIATGDGTTYECLLVPSEINSDRQAVTLSLTIDGEDKSATLSGDNGVIFAQGTQSNITITLSNSGISVRTVSVENWNVVEVGEYKVTITVANGVTAGDIMCGAYVDGNNVVIRASSYSGQRLKCTMADGEFCTSQSKTSNLVYTFTISDVTSNTTATIGYANPVSIALSPADAGCKVIVIDGEFYEGEVVRLVPEAAYAYGIDCWKDNDGNTLSDGYDYTVRLSQDVQITACFEENLALGGVFTVANDGKGNVKKVRFTRGNLYYDGSSNVEQHQYDFNSNQWTSSTAHVSHFIWCNNIANATSLQYNTGWNGQDPFFANDNTFTVNGFESGKCFALSNVEWAYLINTREASTINGTSNARFFKGCINKEDGKSINGLFIFPDTFTWPSSVKTLPDEINESSSGYDNTYTYNDFKRLQDAGMVFLPAAGYRNGLRGSTYVDAAGNDGYYWSASPSSGSSAYDLNFFSGYVDPYHYINRSQAYAVRLVTDVNAETE